VLQFPGQVDEAHRLAKHVFTWTVNREEDMRRLAELGVDAIMSDHPTLLLRTLGG
jgi:glycerophosphoryl diester phosphodiesterase